MSDNGLYVVYAPSMYYRDPDGNRVELQIDNFATAEEGQAWMFRLALSSSIPGSVSHASMVGSPAPPHRTQRRRALIWSRCPQR